MRHTLKEAIAQGNAATIANYLDWGATPDEIDAPQKLLHRAESICEERDARAFPDAEMWSAS